jgi:hypothetical protein
MIGEALERIVSPIISQGRAEVCALLFRWLAV